jgi:hypothetical protein
VLTILGHILRVQRAEQPEPGITTVYGGWKLTLQQWVLERWGWDILTQPLIPSEDNLYTDYAEAEKALREYRDGLDTNSGVVEDGAGQQLPGLPRQGL